MSIWQLLSSFPTAIPTVLLAVLLIYWLLSIVGVIDLGDHTHIDLDLDGGHVGHADGHGTDLGTLAGYLVAFGLGGVPLSVVASVLVFCTWLATALLHRYAIVHVPTDTLRWVAGAGVLLFSCALAIPITARVLKPMRGLFVKHAARSNSSLVGLSCKILTQSVDERFGRAAVDNHGVSLNIRVWARVPNTLVKNADAIILDYNAANQQYEVQAAPGQI